MRSAPLPNNEQARLEELYHYDILDSPPDEGFDDLAKLAAHICGTPIALVSLIDIDRQWCKAIVGLDVPEIPREVSFCAHAIRGTDLFVVPDATQDERFADNPFVTADPPIHFYAGMPLVTSTGHAMGTLCVLDRIPRQLTTEQLNALRMLGRQVMSLLELKRHQRTLEVNQRSLAQAQALAHVGSWDWDTQTGAEIWSDEQYRIFGYAPHAIIPSNETFREAIHPDDRAHVFKAIEEALSQNVPYEVVCRIVRPNKDIREVLCRGSAMRDTTGDSTRMMGTVQDITERKIDERTLRDAIHRLDLAARSGGIGVFDFYVPENKLVWDQKMYELYGYTVENFPGAYEAWSRRLHPDDKLDAEFAVQAAIMGEEKFDTEFRLILPDQSIRYIKASAVVLMDAQGQAVRMIGVNYDITARKESEQALRRLQGFQQAILFNAPHAVIATTTTGVIQHFNPAAEQLLGYSADEMVGKLTPATFHDPDEVAARATIFGAELGIELEPGFEVFVAKARRNLPNQHEWIYIRKGGTRIPVLLSVTAIHDHSGTITGFLGMAIDISGQKEAEWSRAAAEAALREKEDLTRAMVENVVDYSIIRLDPDGNIVSWNQGSTRINGYESEEILGRHFSCFYSEEDQRQDKPTRLLRQATVHHHAEDEGWRVRKDGSRYWASAVITALFDQEGRLKGFTKVVRDITERKEAEERLKLTAQELASKNTELLNVNQAALAATRAKSEFLTAMSHEIRTPMNAIVGMADVLAETPLTSEQHDYVRIFQKAGQNLLVLINDILDLSKIEAGHFDLKTTDFDLDNMLERIGELMAMPAHTKDLDLAFYRTPDVPTFLSGDPNRLRQLLINLIGNAIKFTHRGEVVVRVENDPEGGEPGGLLFSVSDTGMGIPADKTEKIFERFAQADASIARDYGGTGLGLAISKGLVERMGGRIWVESQVGRGSTFRFTARFGVQSASQPRQELGSVDLGGSKILVVDDNSTNRLILREACTKWGAVVTEVSDGQQALAELKRAQQEGAPYRLVLMDMRMPVMNGVQAFQRIHEDPCLRDTKVLMLTSDFRGDDLTRCSALGLAGHLTKPIRRSLLLPAVTAALGETVAISQAPPTPVHQMGGGLSAIKILLVEDFADNRAVIRAYLKNTPYRLDMAENGQIGVDKFKAEPYDLVLMDIQMPVMDGYAATRAMRMWEAETGRPPTAIIALTAYALREESEKCFAAGCTTQLTKPIKKAVLLDAITSYTAAQGPSEVAEVGTHSGTTPPTVLVQVEEELRELMPEFLANRHQDVEMIRTAIEREDFETIRHLGHGLKGAGGSYGLQTFSEIGAGFERAARESDGKALAKRLVELTNYLNRIELVYE